MSDKIEKLENMIRQLLPFAGEKYDYDAMGHQCQACHAFAGDRENGEEGEVAHAKDCLYIRIKNELNF